jgi:hypothetical protein
MVLWNPERGHPACTAAAKPPVSTMYSAPECMQFETAFWYSAAMLLQVVGILHVVVHVWSSSCGFDGVSKMTVKWAALCSWRGQGAGLSGTTGCGSLEQRATAAGCLKGVVGI